MYAFYLNTCVTVRCNASSSPLAAPSPFNWSCSKSISTTISCIVNSWTQFTGNKEHNGIYAITIDLEMKSFSLRFFPICRLQFTFHFGQHVKSWFGIDSQKKESIDIIYVVNWHSIKMFEWMDWTWNATPKIVWMFERVVCQFFFIEFEKLGKIDDTLNVDDGVLIRNISYTLSTPIGVKLRIKNNTHCATIEPKQFRKENLYHKRFRVALTIHLSFDLMFCFFLRREGMFANKIVFVLAKKEHAIRGTHRTWMRDRKKKKEKR